MRIRKKTINPQEEIINQKANEFIMKDKIKYYLIEILNDNIGRTGDLHYLTINAIQYKINRELQKKLSSYGLSSLNLYEEKTIVSEVMKCFAESKGFTDFFDFVFNEFGNLYDIEMIESLRGFGREEQLLCNYNINKIIEYYLIQNGLLREGETYLTFIARAGVNATMSLIDIMGYEHLTEINKLRDYHQRIDQYLQQVNDIERNKLMTDDTCFMEKQYPHKCHNCSKKIDYFHAYMEAIHKFNKGTSNPTFQNLFKKWWKSGIVQFYCCTCYKQLNHRRE